MSRRLPVPQRDRPVGVVTRGTTNPNRLRRVDRWLARELVARHRPGDADPVVVDLGFGASPVTTVELFRRLRSVRPGVQVVGLEIDPARVEAALPYAEPGLRFGLGGFELPLADGGRPLLVRAFNVLRQYPPEQVGDAWALMASRLAPGGVLVDGTCDEIGRLSTWLEVPAPEVAAAGADKPVSLTLSWRLGGLERPGVIAERLPKALIHHNVPGQPVHTLLEGLDGAWARAAGAGSFGARQRFLAMVADVREQGWPVLGGPSRWRLGELSVPWDAVAPAPPASTNGAAPL